MGRLRGPDPEREVELPTRCLVGRAPACDLVLDGKTVSGHHAVLEWNGAGWEVQDLRSRNGTYLDDQKMVGGGRRSLASGMRLCFGRASAAWTLVDAAAPQMMARSLSTGEYRVGDGGYLVLPDGAAPECCVYQDPLGRWVAEQRSEPGPIEDQQVITLSAGAWRVHLPSVIAGTLQDQEGAVLLVHLRLRFSVSLDEEHVALVATCGEQTWDLQSRAHHYPLLLLARRRIADLRLDSPSQSRGGSARTSWARCCGWTTITSISAFIARGRRSASSGSSTRRRWSNAGRGPGRCASASVSSRWWCSGPRPEAGGHAARGAAL